MAYKDADLNKYMKQTYLEYVIVVPSKKDDDKLSYWKNIWDGIREDDKEITCDNRFCRYEMLKKLGKPAGRKTIVGATVYEVDYSLSANVKKSSGEYIVPLCKTCVQDSEGIVIELEDGDAAKI